VTEAKPTLFEIPPDLRERIRLSIVQRRATGKKVSARAIAREVKSRQVTVGVLLHAERQGLLSVESSWNDSFSEDVMVHRIERATSDAQRAQLCIDISKGIYLGQIPATVGRAMGAMIGEARLCDRNVSEAEQSGAEPVYLLSEAGITLGRLLDKILSAERRADALRRVEALVREDLAEFPNPTRDEVEALRQEARS